MTKENNKPVIDNAITARDFVRGLSFNKKDWSRSEMKQMNTVLRELEADTTIALYELLKIQRNSK